MKPVKITYKTFLDIPIGTLLHVRDADEKFMLLIKNEIHVKKSFINLQFLDASSRIRYLAINIGLSELRSFCIYLSENEDMKFSKLMWHFSEKRPHLEQLVKFNLDLMFANEFIWTENMS